MIAEMLDLVADALTDVADVERDELERWLSAQEDER